MKEYGKRVASRLEEKNRELASRTKELEQAKANLEIANRELDLRLLGRTAEFNAASQELEAFS